MSKWHYYLPVAGTWGLFHGPTPDDPTAWHRPPPGSKFGAYMARQGFCLLNPDVPFLWSTALDGVRLPIPGRRPSWPHWEAGAAAFYYYSRMPSGDHPLAPSHDTYVPLLLRIIFAHSHALQLVLIACARYKLKVRALVSIGSPIREGDFVDIAAAARPHIGYWAHFYAPGDRWQMAGSLLDGRLGFSREALYVKDGVVVAQADRNIAVPRAAGHTGLIEDERYMPLLEQSGVLKDLRQLAA